MVLVEAIIMADNITKEMTLGEAVSKFPETAVIMMRYGLHCIGCHVASWETIEQGALGHGLTAAQVKDMVAEMNAAISMRDEALNPAKAPKEKKEKKSKSA